MRRKFLQVLLLLISIMLIMGTVEAKKVSKQETDKTTTSMDIYEDLQENPGHYLQYIFKDDEIFNGQTEISEQRKQNNNYMIIGCSVLLFIYWIILLVTYEKEDEFQYSYEDDREVLNKYNPLIAGCMVDSRDVLARDVIAVLINMYQKGIVQLNIVPSKKLNEQYRYKIKRMKENEDQMDEIEQWVHNLFFEVGYNSNEEIDLDDRLKEISHQKGFYKKIEELNRISKNQLYKIGANKPKVPKVLRIINIVLLIISILMIGVHISNNGLDVHIYRSTTILISFGIIVAMVILPLIALAIHIVMLIMAYTRRVINKVNERRTGQRIIATSIAIGLTFLVIIIITAIFVPNKYLILDEILLGMAILLVRTDHIMLKNEEIVLNDYYNLKRIKEKIEEYTLLSVRNIEYTELWEEYLTYAIAFGIPIEIIKKMKETYTEDKDIEYLNDCELLYGICKGYLEVMWGFKFKKSKSVFRL